MIRSARLKVLPDEGTDDRQHAPLGDDFRMPVDDQRRPPGKPEADRQIDQRERGVVIHHVDPLAAVCQTRTGNEGEIGIDQTLLRAPARCTSIPSTISEAPGPRTRETSTSLRHQRVRPAARSRMISGMPPLTFGNEDLEDVRDADRRIGWRIAKPGSRIPDLGFRAPFDDRGERFGLSGSGLSKSAFNVGHGRATNPLERFRTQAGQSIRNGICDFIRILGNRDRNVNEMATSSGWKRQDEAGGGRCGAASSQCACAHVMTGKDGFIAYFERMAREWPGNQDYAGMDIFRRERSSRFQVSPHRITSVSRIGHKTV